MEREGIGEGWLSKKPGEDCVSVGKTRSRDSDGTRALTMKDNPPSVLASRGHAGQTVGELLRVRFSKRPCFKKLRWNAIEEDIHR